jgi:hypothetical protein
LFEYSPGKRYQPSDSLLDWVNRWQMVEVRHIFTFGLQAIWASFLLLLQSKLKISKEEWLDWIQMQVTSLGWNITVNQLGENLCSEENILRKFDELLDSKLEHINLATELDEYSLFLKAEKNRNDPVVLFQIGIKILLQLYMRFYNVFNQQENIWNELANRPRISINSYFQLMSKSLEKSNFQVIDWINWLFQELIFEQHEMMALEKMRYQGYDTFKFYYEDNTFHWPSGKEPYQEPIRLAGNRLNNCISMLIDLGLVLEGEEKILTLSADGKVYHSKIIMGLKNANQS